MSNLDKMGVLEKISEALATNEAKKDRLRKFILLLMLEWEDYESHLNLTESSFRECLAELQARESHLRSVQESVSQSSKEMDLIRESLEERFAEVAEKEKEFHLFKEKGSNELKVQEETLNMIREEIEVREEKMDEQEKLIQGVFGKIELEQKQFEVIRNLVGERFNELGLKENQIEQRVNELDMKEQKVMLREKEIEARERILDLKKKEIKLKERNLDFAKISKKHLPVPDSGVKHGLHLNEEGKQSSDVPGHRVAHHLENVTDHRSEKLLDSSADSTTIWKSCCCICDVRNEKFKNSPNKDFFCQNCSKYYIAFPSAMSHEVNGHIRRLRSCTGRNERNNNVGGDARSEENVGNVSVLNVGIGNLDVPGIDDTQPRESGELLNKGRKRGSIETENVVNVAAEVFGVSDYHCSRRSSVQIQLISKKGRENGAFDVASSSKRLRGSKSCSYCADKREKAMLGNCSACGNAPGFSADVDNGKARMGYEGSACNTEESLQNYAGNFDVTGSGSAAGHLGIGIIYPPGEFYDFEKHREENYFFPGQIWACYDDTPDAMPRYYAQVRKVHTHPFKLRITWLLPHSEYEGGTAWVNRDLPVAFGEFARADSKDMTNIRIFSHQVNYDKITNRDTYMIYPRKGEVWALFKDWDIRWRSDSESHKKIRYEYEFVEVVTEYVESTGIKVALLDKIGRKLSLFQRTIQGNSFLIPPNELLRFSHRVPSYKMNGTEGEGVPEGSFELDPASIPLTPQ